MSLTFRTGKQNAVDVLTGSNTDEANFGICAGAGLTAAAAGQTMTADGVQEAAQRRFGELAENT